MRVAIYARVSTTDKGQDTENQLRELRELVANRSRDGWEPAGEYIDHASAKTGNRVEFQRLFEDAGNRKFDLVLFWALDRFSREGVLATLQYLRRLTTHDVDWWSYREEYLRSVGPWRDAVLGILATVAAQERVRISDRTKAGLARARREGRIGGRPARVFDRKKAQKLRDAGLSWRVIEHKMGIAQSTIRKALATPK